MQISIVFFLNLHGVFINTFLLKATGDLNVILKYNMIVFFAQACMMVVSVYLVRATTLMCSIRLGLVLHAVIYLGIMVFGAGLAKSYTLIALVFAAAGGFTTLPYGVMVSEFTQDQNRDQAMGFLNMWFGIAALSIPAVAGLIISVFPGFGGYRVIFFLAFLIVLMAYFLSTRVDSISAIGRQAYFGSVIRSSFCNQLERLMYLASTLASLREGVFRFILSAILFQIVRNEAIIGFNSLICGLAAVIASWVYGKIVKPGNRIACMNFSVSVMLLGSILMLFNPNQYAIVLFGVLSSLCNVFIVTPQDNYTYLMLQVVERMKNKRPEFQTVKEFFLAVGRNGGIILMILMIQWGWGYIIPMIVVIASQYLMIFVTKLAAAELDRVQATQLTTDPQL